MTRVVYQFPLSVCLQTILGVLDFSDDLKTAIDDTRAYVVWNGENGKFKVTVEEDRDDFDELNNVPPVEQGKLMVSIN